MFPIFTKLITFGTVNIDNNYKITFKDPITGMLNIHKDMLNLTRSLSEGVWLGKRPLDGKQTAFNSLLFEHFGWNTQHYCFMFEGQAYHLQTTNAATSVTLNKYKQEEAPIQLVCMNQDKQDWEWFYKGPSKRSKATIKNFIEKINSLKEQYCLITKNCQHFAKAFCLYAREILSEGDVISLIFDKDSTDRILDHFTWQTTGASALEIVNTIKKYFE